MLKTENDGPDNLSPIIDQHGLIDGYGKGYSKNNGCAWIAIYNIMLLSGNYMPEQEIKYELIKTHSLLLNGILGTKPRAVFRFIKQKLNNKYRVVFHRSLSEKRSEYYAEGCEYVIITCLWINWKRGKLIQTIKSIKSAAHTFAGRRTNDNRFEFYNETYNNKVICTTSELFRKKTDGKEYGYCIPICIVSISKKTVL